MSNSREYRNQMEVLKFMVFSFKFYLEKAVKDKPLSYQYKAGVRKECLSMN